MNDLGSETFKSLCEHSRSLKRLGLFSLERIALQSLNQLQPCLSLESLKLESAWSARHYPWQTECKEVFQDVKQWLQKCSHLEELAFTEIPASTTILAEVLRSPDIHLVGLNIKTADLDKDFCASLPKQQQQLRYLAVKIPDEELLEASDERHVMLANAIACCHELRELDTNELFTYEEVENICDSLPLLDDIVLNGDLIDDVFLGPLMRLSKLKALSIYGPSVFSPDVLLDFIDHFGADPNGEHEGLQVYITSQNYDKKFTPEQEARIATALWDQFRGRFDINYRQDPDELHESDFSD
jgi:hypothetical protein